MKSVVLNTLGHSVKQKQLVILPYYVGRLEIGSTNFEGPLESKYDHRLTQELCKSTAHILFSFQRFPMLIPGTSESDFRRTKLVRRH